MQKRPHHVCPSHETVRVILCYKNFAQPGHCSLVGLGVSALLMASAEAFAVLKFAGALYLIWLGIRAFREARALPFQPKSACSTRAFREGVVVEATNPKTAAFFLAFIPQFLDVAAAHPALQFMALGLISVALNTFADLIVVALAAATRANFTRRPLLLQRAKQGSGLFMIGLGASLLLARRPAAS